MKGGACLGCCRLVANTAAGAIGVGVGGRCRYAHTACLSVAIEKARELEPAPAKAPGGKLVYARRCPNCGRKVKRGTVQASQGYVWHAIPGRDPHLLWTPANLGTDVRA